MSFHLTAPQILARTKTVTRRLGWAHAKPGELICAVEKYRGVKRDDRRVLATLRVIDVREERLGAITVGDCFREGFPKLLPHEFVSMFCREMGCTPVVTVRRIEFEYVGDAGEPAGG